MVQYKVLNILEAKRSYGYFKNFKLFNMVRAGREREREFMIGDWRFMLLGERQRPVIKSLVCYIEDFGLYPEGCDGEL